MDGQSSGTDALSVCSPAQGGRSPPQRTWSECGGPGRTAVRRPHPCGHDARTCTCRGDIRHAPANSNPSRPRRSGHGGGVLGFQSGRSANRCVESPRSSPHQPGSGGRRHRSLRLRQPRRSGHGHPDRQLLPDAGPGRVPQLLSLRRRRYLPHQHRQQRRCGRGHLLPVGLRHRDRQSQLVPLQLRTDRFTRQPEPQRPPDLHPLRRAGRRADRDRQWLDDAAGQHRAEVDAGL